ncbi:uncharacterized protein BO72DRAFT_84509 [Aspergillus fijiensis CBS 313.89]|uniref:Uncharacterized protein n=1 Tax=Aspergillus fijiensis CBS 313.89 TaxID=1448319 RepID=A0A8G1RRF6_9EURO|nr:uncharacterized protein BO72DRAFT_84509 [Aspergillus fijiensis CBS 313.89]RAK78110.1 hypothetical protein BO72DRAFT_84509 [Aspergillus fijiensis CBS 313.89]
MICNRIIPLYAPDTLHLSMTTAYPVGGARGLDVGLCTAQIHGCNLQTLIKAVLVPACLNFQPLTALSFAD